MNYLDEAGKWLGLPEEESINEDAGSMVILAFFALLFGPDIYEKIKNIKTDTSYVVSDKEINKIPNYGDKNEKMALSTYAYYKLGINNAEKNTLLYNSNSNINKNVYLYKFNKSKIKLIYNGPFDKLCKKYGIKMKPMNETKLKDREKVYKQTVSLVKQELNKYKELKAKADFESGKENYNNFINGLDNYITIFYCEVWDVAPRPRSNDPEDVEYTNKVAYEPIQNIINTVNSKLPKDYKLDSWGDWDDLDLTLFYNGKLSEGCNITETRDIKMNYLDEDVKWFGLPKSNNKFTDSELHTLAKLIQKELKPIVNKFNNDSKYIKKIKESLIKNEEFKGSIPKLEYNYKLNGSNEIYFVIIDDEQNIRNSIRYVLDDIIKELTKTKIISELSPKISTGDGDEGCIYFIFNRNKCQKYLNESYIFETGGVNMNSINNLASIAENCNIENSNRLRDDIVLEYTDILETLDSIDESVINKDISTLPIYKINKQESINEGLFNRVREKINHYNWKLKAKKNNYEALTENVIPYKRKETHSKSDMDRFYKNNDFCIECLVGDEKSCQVLANILGSNYDIKTPVEIYIIYGKDMNKIYDLYGDNAYPDDIHHVIIPLDTLKNRKDIVSAKYKINARYFNDIVDNNEYREYIAGRHKKSEQIQWIINVYNESSNIEEGYAIDLSSLKYVVESEECTLEDAVQKIRDVNYIGDTYPMYCILPEDINENMSLESFITLNHSLTESGIIPAVINEKNLNRKDWKEVGKEYKYSDRFRFKQTFQVLTDVDTIKNMFDDPTKTGNFEKIRPRLLRLANKCKTLDDVNYLKRDARAAKVQLTKLKQNRPNIAKQIDAHIKWIETDYMNALNDKAKEIKSKK